MKPFGTQLLAEFSGCSNHKILDDPKGLERLLQEAIVKCGLGCMKVASHHFDPYGVTAIAIISESHAALHTYPEADHVSIDIFTCSDSDKTHFILDYLKQVLKPQNIEKFEIKRGIPIEIVSK